ncbi:MAG: low molecular weight phosphotyrosine protein phosphatase [Anaerolineae bacterium]|nr:low molecular weight phosphotyrosine protein phosphatase [Gloeobacterales cyanobacterium ES-bin-313]
MTEKLLFVCMGNICRSPTAEGIMVHLLQEAGLESQFECDSAGTTGHHVGSPPDRRMQASAQAAGITLRGRSRKFVVADFERFDRILAMDRDNYEDMLALDPAGRYAHKVKMICDYCTEHTDKEVPDPYYGGDAGFRYVIALLKDACSGLLETLRVESSR